MTKLRPGQRMFRVVHLREGVIIVDGINVPPGKKQIYRVHRYGFTGWIWRMSKPNVRQRSYGWIDEGYSFHKPKHTLWYRIQAKLFNWNPIPVAKVI